MLSLRKLSTQSSSFGLSYQVSNSFEQWTAGDIKRDMTPLLMTAHWKLYLSALRQQPGWAEGWLSLRHTPPSLQHQHRQELWLSEAFLTR